MDWLNLVIDLINQLIALRFALADIVKQFIINPCRSSPEFGKGLITGFIVAGIVGFCFSRILLWRAQIHQYFSATQIPATKPGPSPFRIYSSCLSATFKLLLFGGMMLFAISIFLLALGD